MKSMVGQRSWSPIAPTTERALAEHARMLSSFDQCALGEPCDLGRDRRHDRVDEGARKRRIRVFDYQRELGRVGWDVPPRQ